MTAPVFVCGTSRSGTSVLIDAMKKLPGCSITDETHYFDDLRPRLRGQDGRILGEEDYLKAESYFRALTHRPYGYSGVPSEGWLAAGRLEEHLGTRPRTLDEVFRAYNEVTALHHGGTWWGEKTPRHVLCIPEILTAFPEAKVVVMRRDPRAVVASYRDWKTQGDLPDRVDLRSRALEEARRERSYHPVTISLLWRAAQNAAIGAVERFGPDHVRIVSFERVVECPEEGLSDLVRWLGAEPVTGLTEVPTRNSSYDRYRTGTGFNPSTVDRWRTLLTPGEVRVIEQATGRVLGRCGYLRASKNGRLGALKHWLSFPIAAARAAHLNASRSGGLLRYILRRARLVLGRA